VGLTSGNRKPAGTMVLLTQRTSPLHTQWRPWRRGCRH